MTFIKIGNRIINTETIALVHLDLGPDRPDTGIFHRMILTEGTELIFNDEAEVRVVRQYFKDLDYVQDLLALDELSQLSKLLLEVRNRIVATKQPVPPLVALACMHIHEAIGAEKLPDLDSNADLLSDSARELLTFLEGNLLSMEGDPVLSITEAN